VISGLLDKFYKFSLTKIFSSYRSTY